METRNQLFDLSGKVALITGAGSGLGRAFAQGLGAFGAHVVCADRNESWAQETATTLVSTGAHAEPLHVDVTDADAVEAMAGKLAASPGRVDVLINNAGIATPPALVHEMTIEDWDRLMAVNLRAVFLCTRAIIPLMLATGGGSIINIASIIGIVGYPGVGANYAAAKAGVTGFTRQVAVEYASRGIRVNAIAPGWHGGTRLGDERRAASSPEATRRFEESIVRGTPMGRRGTPEELRGLVIYLASDASSYVTGQVFVQDGGWVAW